MLRAWALRVQGFLILLWSFDSSLGLRGLGIEGFRIWGVGFRV